MLRLSSIFLFNFFTWIFATRPSPSLSAVCLSAADMAINTIKAIMASMAIMPILAIKAILSGQYKMYSKVHFYSFFCIFANLIFIFTKTMCFKHPRYTIFFFKAWGSRMSSNIFQQNYNYNYENICPPKCFHQYLKPKCFLFHISWLPNSQSFV